MMRKRVVSSLSSVALVCSLGSCLPTGPKACTTQILPAVELEIVDARTGAPAGAGARGIVWDGAYVDSLRPRTMTGTGEVRTLGAADGRAGTYAARVEKAGYQTWEATGLRTRSDGCQPQVRRRVVLVAIPAG